MKRLMTLLLAALPLAGACAREGIVGSGVITTETRQMGEFDRIELRIAADLKIEIGQPSPLTIETDDNILPWIETEVRDGKLVISTDNWFKTRKGPDISVTLADLKALEVAGSGDLQLFGKTEELDIKISGSGDVIVKDMDNKATKLELAGSADVRLYGKTNELDIKISGSSDVFASSLQAEEAHVSITGSGDVRVHVTQKLDVRITGSGDVVYRGSPRVNAKVTGSGNVTKSSEST